MKTIEQMKTELDYLKDSINNLIWDFDNGHLSPYELVKKIKELTF